MLGVHEPVLGDGTAIEQNRRLLWTQPDGVEQVRVPLVGADGDLVGPATGDVDRDTHTPTTGRRALSVSVRS